MGKTSRTLLAIPLVLGLAACETDEPDVETFDAEETATPAIEPETATRPADMPLVMAQFEPVGEATEGRQITGTVRIFADDGTGLTGSVGATGPATGTQPGTRTETMGTQQQGLEDDVGTRDRARTDTDRGLDATARTGTTAGQDGLRLEVEVAGLPEGEHAWHIHEGRCGEDSRIAVAITETETEDGLGDPLEGDDDPNERVTEEVDIPADQLTIEQLRSGQYSLNIHQGDAEQPGTPIACADLSGSANTGMTGTGTTGTTGTTDRGM